MTFPEDLCLRECAVKDLLNYSVLIFDDFRFLHTSDPRSRTSSNSCFLLTPLNIKTGGRKWPTTQQHAFNLTFPLFSPDVNTRTFLDPFSVITESGLFICMLLLSMFQMFPCVSERLFLVPNFSSILKNVKTIFWFIIWALAKDGVSLQRSLWIPLQKNKSIYFSQAYPALPVSSLKLFEIPISLAILYAVALNVCWCCSEYLNMRNDFYGLLSCSEKAIQSSWQIEQ